MTDETATARPVWDEPVTVLDGVGAAVARRLGEGLGIHTLGDLAEHWPRRYHDAGALLDLGEVAEGEPATLLGEVVGVAVRTPASRSKRGRLEIVETTVRQASGQTFVATFFNQRWRASQLIEGTVAAFSGKVSRFRGNVQLSSPDVQILGRVQESADLSVAADRLQHQRLLAIYPTVDGLTNSKLAGLIEAALERLGPIADWLPTELMTEHGLISRDRAVRDLHQPSGWPEQRAARHRLAFDELFQLQLGLQVRRARLSAASAGLDNRPVVGGWAERFLAALPFELTQAQRRALSEVGADLAVVRPMHRLLQGDVGAGKTVIALWTMLNAVDHGRQAALMAPTEVLAEQHLRTLSQLLAPLGVNVLDGLRLEVLTSSSTTAHRRRVLGELLSGALDLVVGTHALLEEGVRFAGLGVAVIDEQHRFGVAQRVRLREKASDPSVDLAAAATMPDVLVMTATPIPRSLAMTVYGDLDVTVLDELPPGRQPVVTQLIEPDAAHRREALYDFVRKEALQGRRTYVVCPLVEPSQAVAGTSVIEEHRRLSTEVFPDLNVALMHGQMRADDKDAAMQAFRTGQAHVLVATTVIEVGVDVPEATLMVIEDAERFGISQLHQLRGRVGRGTDRAFCVLFAGWNAALSDESRQRLEAVCATTDGFELAETDLSIRGAGQLFGRRQSGLPDLRLARLDRDVALIAATRQAARAIVAADPDLARDAHRVMAEEIDRRFDGGLVAFEALQTG